MKSGFTLIELSIVLVIIGLIVGGVLVGRDLIAASEIRGQVSQIEKYRTALNTFKIKYDGLPGDMTNDKAASFGFGARRNMPLGQGDGNGLVQGTTSIAAEGDLQSGENLLFWNDLTVANLLDTSISACTTGWCILGAVDSTTSPTIQAIYPKAKIGGGNAIYVYSCGLLYCYNADNVNFNPWDNGGFGDGYNYFGLSVPVSLAGNGLLASNPGITAQQAYNVDTKIDDGLPQSGKVRAFYIHTAAPAIYAGGSGVGANPGVATPASSTTCYDNGNNASNPMAYSVSQNNGSGLNCALSFRF